MDQAVYRFGLSHATHSRGFFREATCFDTTSYSEAAFTRYQRRTIETELTELVHGCRRQLAYSVLLLRPGAPMDEAMGKRANLDRMIIPWDRLCVFYRHNHFDPQLDFFDCHTLREQRRWRKFIGVTCTEPFTTRHEWTRSLLEAAEIIPTVPQSTSIPIEDLFDAILATLKGEDHELEWLF